MKLKQSPGGVVLPDSEQPAIKQTFVQEDLIRSQLPRFVKMLDDHDAEFVALFPQINGGLGGRFTCVYRHTEKFSVEIYT